MLQPPAGVWKETMWSAILRAASLRYQTERLFNGMERVPRSVGGTVEFVSP